MNAPQLVGLLAFSVILSWVLRFTFRNLCAAEEGFASLFVMCDRTLGWPRGVQESDEPWGWQTAPTPPEVAGGPDDARPGDPSADRWPPVEPARAGLVVPISRVRPVHVAVRLV